MTDSTGTVVWAADYKPFGEATVTVSTIINNLRFPGQYFDVETGLNYNYHRDYNSVIGRYIEADPVGLAGGRNHLFSYVGNNPIRSVDPLGLCAWDLCIAEAWLIDLAATATVMYFAGQAYDEVQQKAERDAYHKRCDEPTPPGLDPCEQARWELEKAKDCKQMRENFAQKWCGNTYDKGHNKIMQQLQSTIDKLEKFLKSKQCCGK